MPGPSSPDGVAARVSSAPSCAGGGVHEVDRRGDAAGEAHGQRVGGVVARRHHHRVEDLADRVLPARADPDARALLVGVLLGPGDRLVEGQALRHEQPGERLHQRRRAQPRVRVAGGEHLARVEVGEDVGHDADRGRRRGALGDDVTAGAHRRSADGRVGDRQRPRLRLAGLRRLGLVDRGPGRGAELAGRVGRERRGRHRGPGQRGQPDRDGRRDRREHPSGAHRGRQ